MGERCGGLMFFFFFFGSQCVPEDVPIRHLTFIPYVFTKVGDLPNHNMNFMLHSWDVWKAFNE